MARMQKCRSCQQLFPLGSDHDEQACMFEQLRGKELTWEQFVAGEPCPGCGLPWMGKPWPWGEIRAKIPEEHLAEYDAELERYQAAHGDCHAFRQSLTGYLTMHCGRCCPMPPLSPHQIAALATLLGRHLP